MTGSTISPDFLFFCDILVNVRSALPWIAVIPQTRKLTLDSDPTSPAGAQAAMCLER
ncbi:MAG: hypothetical protein M3N38_07990 [Pseudomonadota bacterium]|nr:hypothetical protein [Pseudomonadota bacterium]